MTAKEQALELYGKFFSNAESRNYIGLYDEDLHKYNAKQCVLIAVDEIIKSSPARSPINDSSDFMPHFKAVKYWQEVKQEIEKL
jgi:hypothetical protein